MQNIIELIKKKNQLIYDINCVKGYIETKEYDSNLKKAWERFTKDLEEVTKKLDELKKPQLEKLEKEKIELIASIKSYEEKINISKKQLNDIDKIIKEIDM